jgi:hypothetical protein
MRKKSSLLLLFCITLLLMLPLELSSTSDVSKVVILESKYSIDSGVSNGHTLINKTFFQPSDQAADALIQLEDGSYVLGGYAGNSLGEGLILLGADADGNYEWNTSYSPGAALRRMILCNDSGFALLGMILPEGAGTDDWLVVRTNSSHGQQWNHTYGGSGYDYPSGIVELQDGFMLGGSYTNVSGANLDYILIRTDINGTPLWNVTFGDSENQWCDQMIGCSDGGFLLCGYTWNPVTNSDIWLVKTDSSGNRLWNRTFSTGEHDKAHAVVELQDGGYAIAGGINDGNEGVLLLLRLDSEGNQLWNRTYARGADRTFDGYSIVETPDHGFCLRGRETYLLTNDTFWLVRTDCSGNKLWEYALGPQSVRVYSLINAPGGGFVTAGTIGEYGTEEWDFHLMLFPELDWVEVPTNQLWFTNVIPIPTYQLHATSAAPIQSWHVNDTHFTIDSFGLLTNTTLLNGTYNLRITITDSVDNILTKDIVIYATMRTLPTPTTTAESYFPIDLLVIGIIGSIAIIIVLVVVIKTKKG